MKSEYTRTGVRRSGDDYQDIIALEILVDMLKYPNRYKWIQVEADDSGSLDDVVALRNDDQLIAKQIKFSAHPDRGDDHLTWEKLLEKKKGKNDRPLESLLEKWGSSFFDDLKPRGPIYEVSVVSNRIASEDLQAALSANGLVNLDKICDSKIKYKVITQLGDETRAREFFSQFHFSLDQQGLEEKEESVKKVFYSLGGKPEGWQNLRDKLRQWIRKRDKPSSGGNITLNDIKHAAYWYQLQSMPQLFEIPNDYVIPSDSFHKAFLQDLSKLHYGCIAITASPGVGKSTYLSYLFDYLEKKDIPVIRHHYYLSFSDRTIERLDYPRIAESLMSDLERGYFKALGELETKNPNPSDLHTWVEKCGAFFSKDNKSLVIIIDGLDHVWREKGSKEELNKLFEHLLPAPEGIIVVVGTQPIDEAQLPSSLIRAAPKEQWKELPLLDKAAIKQWLLFHETEFNNFDKQYFRDFELDRLAEIFYKKSQGHPLHLRYTLKALQDQDIPVTEENVEKMPSILHEDINEYYNNLWKDLPEPGKFILYLFASCNFNWQKEWIIDCLEPNGYGQIDIAEGFKQIAHLTVKGPLGIQPFHNSILVFIENQEDYKSYSSRLKRHVIDWLQNKAPNYWKWAYEWRLLSELGDYQSIIAGPSRDWAIDALAKRYPFQDVSDILGEGCWFALKSGGIPRGVEIGLLRDYAEAAYDNSETLEKMLYSQLFLDEDPCIMPRLEKDILNLSGKELFLLAEREYKNGYRLVAAKCLRELNRRMIKPESRHDRYNQDPWSTIVSPALEVAVLMDDVDISSIIDFALINRENNRSNYILNTVCYSIRVYKNVYLMYKILSSLDDLNTPERSVIFEHMMLLALEENIDLDKHFICRNCSFDPFISIYAYFNKIACFRLSNIQFPSYDFMNLDRYQQLEQLGYIEDSIYRTFFCLLANYLWKSCINNETWIRAMNPNPNDTRPYELICRLDIIAKNLSDLFTSNTPPSFGWFYSQMSDLHKPTFKEDRNYYQFALAAERAIDRIAMDILILSTFQNRSILILRSDLELAFRSNYFDIWRWLDNYVSKRRQWIETGAVEWLVCDQKSQLDNSIAEFPERASNYSTLASLATTYDLKKEAGDLINDAASNLISYGWHKDILLYYLLTTIEKCHNAGIGDARQWAINLSPIIAKVRDFTDGDETSDLPKLLAGLLAKADLDLLISYYQWLCEKEEYSDALSALHSFLRISDLSDSINLAVAKTAIDDESILILNERANSGDIGAKAALFTILDLFGEETIDYIKIKKITTSKDESSKLNDFTEPMLPSPQDFPPDRLAEYLSIAHLGNSYFGNDGIVPWIDYWRTTDRKREAFEAIANNGIDFRNYYIMFELALSFYGKDNAYPWLIKANSGSHDVWSYNWIGEEMSVKQMEMVKKYYPSKWLDFILETINSPSGEPWSRLNIYNRFPRLISYCILLGQTGVAEEITQIVINFAIDLISPLKLPVPEWVNKNE